MIHMILLKHKPKGTRVTLGKFSGKGEGTNPMLGQIHHGFRSNTGRFQAKSGSVEPFFGKDTNVPKPTANSLSRVISLSRSSAYCQFGIANCQLDCSGHPQFAIGNSQFKMFSYVTLPMRVRP
jgi:hypothetical protein